MRFCADLSSIKLRPHEWLSESKHLRIMRSLMEDKILENAP
jgi:hypothetical protein